MIVYLSQTDNIFLRARTQECSTFITLYFFKNVLAILVHVFVSSNCGRLNNNTLPDTSIAESPEPVNVTSAWQRTFADVMRGRILRWEGCPGSPRRAACDPKGPCKREAGLAERGDGSRDRSDGATSQGVRAASRGWKRQGTKDLLEPSKGTGSANTLILAA